MDEVKGELPVKYRTNLIAVSMLTGTSIELYTVDGFLWWENVVFIARGTAKQCAFFKDMINEILRSKHVFKRFLPVGQNTRIE